MPLVKIGRQLADELRGLVDGVDRAESGKPSGVMNTSSDGRSGLAVSGESTTPHNHLIFLIAYPARGCLAMNPAHKILAARF